ncbi:hypothetical protein IU487_29675 [Nocardia puris]|uniref:type II toxin-antitoxin system VapC family toxin n=1 Tax=Nocardia puris TaxID=208602 RepID=UPI0011BE0A40|nr:type II toxin-antitoxin system VapC family toxin [Nocardia puris]MBF6215176.1 hypothetical protein [Nocardia puris]
MLIDLPTIEIDDLLERSRISAVTLAELGLGTALAVLALRTERLFEVEHAFDALPFFPGRRATVHVDGETRGRGGPKSQAAQVRSHDRRHRRCRRHPALHEQRRRFSSAWIKTSDR